MKVTVITKTRINVASYILVKNKTELLGPADLGHMWCLQFTPVFTQMLLEQGSKQTTLAVALTPL